MIVTILIVLYFMLIIGFIVIYIIQRKNESKEKRGFEYLSEAINLLSDILPIYECDKLTEVLNYLKFKVNIKNERIKWSKPIIKDLSKNNISLGRCHHGHSGIHDVCYQGSNVARACYNGNKDGD